MARLASLVPPRAALDFQPLDPEAREQLAGTPALLVDRTAIAIDGRTVEWRLSRCLTRDLHYVSELI